MIKKLIFSDLDEDKTKRYRSTNLAAFPEVIHHSPIIKDYWHKLEAYFPHTQLFFFDEEDKLLGFINTIPFYYDQPLTELPNEGWDWLVKKGISDYEKGIPPNNLGGLQIIVPQSNQGKGFSKEIISATKKLVKELGFKNFIIPIRPILKSRHPGIKMNDYLTFKTESEFYDPWIRIHTNNGAQVISVCDKSMYIPGDLALWERLTKRTLAHSGQYLLEGALNPISIDIKGNHGYYLEENIWIYYS